MITQLILAVFLIVHGLIHASYLSPAPPMTEGGPSWPFTLERSWALTPLGLDPGTMRVLGLALVAVTVAGFALAAVAAMGVATDMLWVPAVTVGAVASLALLGLFFQPWLVLGVAIDLVLLWVALVVAWVPGEATLP